MILERKSFHDGVLDQGPRIAILNDTSPTRHAGCTSVMRTIDRSLRRNGLRSTSYWPVSVDWRAFTSHLQSDRLDAVIVNGEGTIHHTAFNERAMQLIDFSTYLYETFRIPTFLINASLFSLDAVASRKLRHFRQIYTREGLSGKFASSWPNYAGTVPDLSFAEFGEDFVSRKTATFGEIYTDSVSAEDADALAGFASDNSSSYVSMICPMGHTERLLNIPNRTQHRLRQIYSGRHAPNRDRPAAHRRPQKLIDIFDQANHVITGRFHAVTLCISRRIPFTAISSNTPKIQGLLGDVFGSLNRLMQPSALEYGHCPSYTSDELTSIENYMTGVPYRINSMFDAIRNSI
jgi:hypothetical protein